MVSSTSSGFLCVAREPVSKKYFMANHELTDWSPAICLAGRCKGHISIGITSPFQPLSPKESCGRTKRFTPDVSSHASPSGGQPTHWRANQYESHRIDTIGSGMGAVSLHLSLTARSRTNCLPDHYQPGSISHPSCSNRNAARYSSACPRPHNVTTPLPVLCVSSMISAASVLERSGMVFSNAQIT